MSGGEGGGRVALLPGEPVRERMGGIGVRYLEMARRLPGLGVEVVLLTTGDPREVPEVPFPRERIRRFAPGRLAEVLADCKAAVAQGQPANDLLGELPELPVAIDLYDPWLVENLHYTPTLGLDPYRNDHATWVLQLSRGDFFLCSSEEQRAFYLGFLTALGRVNPRRVAGDPDLRSLIAPVPFGVPGEGELPPHRPLLPPRRGGERRILFGALYDWYDPWTLLSAVEGAPEGWRVLFVRHPDPEGTPQRLLGEVTAWARERGWLEGRVEILDRVAGDRRFDLLRDVDVLAAPHRPGLETRLALRTRFLDALAVGCPVVTSAGGALPRLLTEHGAGSVVPPGDPLALAAALREALAGGGAAAARVARGKELAAGFRWERVLEPLAAFCRAPRQDATKAAFAFRPPTFTPTDPWSFRARRRWRRLMGRGRR